MPEVMTVREIKAAEKEAAAAGLSEDILIENAAAAVCEEALRLSKQTDKICVLAGGGNNGADGLSAARQLYLRGRNVTVVLVSARLGTYAEPRLHACRMLGIPETAAGDFRPAAFDLIIDAMLGTGCDRPVEGKLAALVRKVNEAGVYTLAVDIPSGLNADTGETETAIEADKTIAFGAIKLGQLIGKGRNYVGELVVADIGIRGKGGVKLVTEEDVVLPRRKPVSHKYDYGRVRILAGSPEMMGASLLAHESAVAALRSGAGLVTLCVPRSLAAVYQAHVREETLRFIPDTDGKILCDEEILSALTPKTSAILIGPGMGQNDALRDVIAYLAGDFAGTLVIDADGLNALAGHLDILRKATARIILTPHMGEFARLCEGEDIDDLPTIEKVRTLAARHGVVIAAKSATTVLSDGESVYLNTTGTPALAKGGSGDVLGGMIAAFSCRLDPLHAAMCGCYRFGKAAEAAEKLYGAESLLASDVVRVYVESEQARKRANTKR